MDKEKLKRFWSWLVQHWFGFISALELQVSKEPRMFAKVLIFAVLALAILLAATSCRG